MNLSKPKKIVEKRAIFVIVAFLVLLTSVRLYPLIIALSANEDNRALLFMSEKADPSLAYRCEQSSVYKLSIEHLLIICVRFMLDHDRLQEVERLISVLQQESPSAAATFWWKLAQKHEENGGNDEAALYAYEKAWELYSPTRRGDTAGRIISAIARLYGRQGEIDKAVQAWEVYVEIEPRHWGFAHIGVYYWDNHHDAHRAFEALENWYLLFPATQPKDIGLWLRLIEASLVLGKDDRALELSKELVSINDDPSSVCLLAEVFERSGKITMFFQHHLDANGTACIQK